MGGLEAEDVVCEHKKDREAYGASELMLMQCSSVQWSSGCAMDAENGSVDAENGGECRCRETRRGRKCSCPAGL